MRRFARLAAIALVLAVGGCASDPAATGEASSMQEEGRRVFSSSPEEAGGGSSESTTGSGDAWAIGLEFFSGAGHEARARQRAAQLAGELGRNDVRVRNRRSGSAVVLGRYSGPDDRRVQRDLDFVHGFRRGNSLPYARAFLTPPPPPPPDRGDLPQYSLLSAQRTPLGERAIYTLQVAVYERTDPERTKRDAERRVVELRQQGEPAFYYHGATQSMVTLGAFSERAFDPRTQQLSTSVRALQIRHPYNLLNGTDQIPEPGGGVQGSMLVRIPESPG